MAAKKKEEAGPDIRSAFLALPVRHRTTIYESGAGPIVLRHLGFFATLDLDGQSKRDSVVRMLMQCAFRPVLGEDGHPLIGEDGHPLTGRPLFEKGDEEWLRVTDHPIDGEVFRLTAAINRFLGAAAEEADVGKSLETD